MPKRSDISSVLVIGAGPIVIGQACEFDYSGTQACQTLLEEGLRVVLANSNPATIMTDPEMAHATYIEPITPKVLEKIIERERPDALLSTVGGQTALNCGLELWRQGILEKYGVRMIGAKPEAIEKAENRQLFNEAMERIGFAVPRHAIVSSLEEAMEKLQDIGPPAIIRPSFTLGGSGGGVAYTEEQYRTIVDYGLQISPTHQVAIDQSILGWKEFEMEVIRDKNDNAIIVCSIENLDPMGVHTGDSITVAPALTLTDKEYQKMRNAAIAILREIGVETGGSNVQFAVNPTDGQLLVIEMNPRVSRSSALASKATGFPIAKVATKLAIGYTLDEIKNDIAHKIPASFEPSLDYVVVKIPRFNFNKFHTFENFSSPSVLSTSMRSVGEVMAIGRSFTESLQKALCSLEEGLTGLNPPRNKRNFQQGDLRKDLATPTPDRLLLVAEAMRSKIPLEEIHRITRIDLWFLREIQTIVTAEEDIQTKGIPRDKIPLLRYKKMGFSDARLAELAKLKEEEVRNLREELGVRPVYKTVDTCAAEFASSTSYLYSCYENEGTLPEECESFPSSRKKVIILGSGPNRIGQGIEFDYACVHGAKALSALGYETIMANCNPETVSTDYNISDKLYFGPLNAECVLDLIRREQQNGELVGVIVQLGGQTPLKLAQDLQEAHVPIIGTSADSIDLTENRERFQKLLFQLDLKSPEGLFCYKIDDIQKTIEYEHEHEHGLGYPVVVRPSHILGGKAMAILHGPEDLESYLSQNRHVLLDGPILIDRFLEDAIEVDVDAICDGEDVYLAGVMEHIEKAGVHSGDSACVLPPYQLSQDMLDQIAKNTATLSKAVKAIGPINIQYAIKGQELYVIEVNPRASRTIPFVAKATGVPVAKIASQVIVGKKLSSFDLDLPRPESFAIKEVVLPFARFPQADPLLGPEMKSTGEAMGLDKNLNTAFAKAQLSTMNGLPQKPGSGLVLVAYEDNEKGREQEKDITEKLHRMGFEITSMRSNIPLKKLAMAICTIRSSALALKKFRRSLVLNSSVPYFTTHEGALRAVEAMANGQCQEEVFSVNPIQRRFLI